MSEPKIDDQDLVVADELLDTVLDALPLTGRKSTTRVRERLRTIATDYLIDRSIAPYYGSPKEQRIALRHLRKALDKALDATLSIAPEYGVALDAMILGEQTAPGGQLEEMDRRIAEAVALYPMHGGLFFQRYQIWLFNGRASAAAALISDRAGRPGGLTDAEWDYYARVAHLFEGRAPADIARFVPEGLAQARSGSAAAQLALEYFAGLGLIGEAFAVADACFFGRGFEVPDRSFPAARSYIRRDDRETFILFDPSTRALRADPRFGRLVEELGLERYWREAGIGPDFRRG